jgi:tetratricopeptide (TPR) repeat protein
MSDTLDGFAERMKKINPLVSLGRGMQLGDLNPFVQNILLFVILEIFYRELNDETSRSKKDIEGIVFLAIQKLNLPSTPEQIERITEGVICSGPIEFNQPFENYYFDENTSDFKTQKYRYLETDRLYSELESGGNIIYKLTDVSQEIVFMSRELQQELSISIEQLYSLQLIKRGNFKRALKNFDTLLSKVRRLLNEELLFQQELIENPKILILQLDLQREQRQKEIQKQFEDEKKSFEEILRLIKRAKEIPDYEDIQIELDQLFDKAEATRGYHDRFANIVIQNIALEVKLKTEHPELFWERSIASFKEQVFDEWIVKHGVNDFSAVGKIIGPMFSPINEFYLPLDWIWAEQEFQTVIENDEFEEENEVGEEYVRRVTDWEVVTDAWEPVMDYLLQAGEYSLAKLSELPIQSQDKWFYEYETFELWMMFGTPLDIPIIDTESKYNDERLILIQHLIKRSDRFKKLQNRKIVTSYDPNQEALHWFNLSITSFKLQLKEIN